MKKLLSFCLCVVLLLGLCVPVFAADTVTVSYRMVRIIVDGATIVPRDANGKPVEPFLYKGSTYLPVRSVANALGLGVEWESGLVKLTSGAARTAAIGEPAMSRRESAIPVGGQDTKVSLDGEILDLRDAAGNPVSPILSNGTTYLPVRAIANALNVPVYWDGEHADVYLGRRIEWLVSKQTHISEYGNSTTTYTYDADGNLLTETTVYPDYTVKETYIYDARGNVLTETYRDSDKDDPSSYSRTYTYDANDNILTERYADDMDPECSYLAAYTYDAQGRETACTALYDSGKLHHSSVTTYDARGNITLEHYQSGEFGYDTVYTYDADGNVLTDKTVYDDGSSTSRTYTYDKNGNRLTEIDDYGDGDVYSYKYTYDDAGNQLSVIRESPSDDGGTSRTETRYAYDGNTTTETFIIDGETSVYTYVYDDFENLIEWTYVSDGYRQHTVYHYDDGGKILSTEATDTDGSSRQTTSYRYDAWGNMIEYTGTYSTIRYEYIAREW